MTGWVGQQLGNYRLLRMLGEGGFAEVYLAEQIHLGTRVAIKVLSTELSAKEVGLFREEARTIAQLKHSHIISILDFGLAGGVPYLVMEFAPGGTLRTYFPEGTPLAPQVLLPYVQQAASALQYAHDQKIIHRDVKPENMLLGEHDELLLSDFGIAVAAQSSRSQLPQDAAGTVVYMAPEQLQGHPRPASDQYALGVVVYERLAGELPFTGSFTEIVAQHLTAPPPSLCEKVPSLSPAIEDVVLTALNKDPKARYSSVEAFAAALTHAVQEPATRRSRTLMPSLVSEPPSSDTTLPNTSGSKASAGRKGWRGMALLASVLLLVLLGGVGALLLNMLSTNNKPSAAASLPLTTTQVVSSSTPTNTSTPTLTPTSTTPKPSPTPSSGSILYQANWSNGLNGWSASDQWTTSGGMLVSDGGVSPNHSNTMDYVTLAPYQSGSRTNYAVEVRMQLIRTVDTLNGCYFGVITRLVAPGQGYLSVVGPNQQDSGGGPSARIQIYTVNTTLAQANYDPGLAWHIYRVEVKNTHIAFLIDGTLVAQANDTSFTSGGQVGLQTYACQLAVSGFTVYSL